MLSLLLTVASLGAPTLEPAPAADSMAIRASRVHVGDGRVIENCVVLVQDGVVRAVGPDVKVPDGVSLHEHDGDLSAGLIALHDYSGAGGETSDSTRPIMEGAELAYAFEKDHPDFERALAAGVTTVVLTPTASNVAGGVTAVVKTSGGRVLKRRGHLGLSLCSSALRSNRFPTSYQGLLGLLDEQMQAGEGAFGEARSGSLPVLMEVRARADVQRAIAFAGRHKLRGALSGASRVGELSAEVHASGLAVVLPAVDVGESVHTLKSAVALAEAGVPFGFGLDAPGRSPANLRFGAALCVREGLEPKTALMSLTAHAATIAGVADKVGRVARGMDADLVLWSGDPLDLGSSIEAVFVDGKQVVGGDEE